MKNYRTFLAGMALAVFTAFSPYLETGNFDVHRDWHKLVYAGGIALFGYLTKDAQVTGLPSDKTAIK